MEINGSTDISGKQDQQVLTYAFLNAFFQAGYRNPIDQAIITQQDPSVASNFEKVDELPYDFIRKRLSVFLRRDDEYILIAKGAVSSILECCTRVLVDSKVMDISDYLKGILATYENQSKQGFRTIAVAYKTQTQSERITYDSEKELVFAGFLILNDPPKSNITETLSKLHALGIQVKIITGDNKLIASQIGRQIGIKHPVIMTGTDLRKTSDEALMIKTGRVDIFAEVEPNQKERIVNALKKAGNVVGYMGDGINDAPALHAADVSISVDTAVDVAKEAAEFVLLEKDLDVLVEGVKTGRQTFANTIKYIMTTMSANFGNMFSMAGASLLLPFLPLLPKQILGINFMTDFPGMTIATDNVDDELVHTPRKWNLNFIVRFMVVFGFLSTFFDYISFGVLMYVGSAQPDIFRSGWFMISIMTELLVMLVIRTRRPFYKSKPSKSLLWSSVLVLVITLALPYTFLAEILSIQPLSLLLMGILSGIVVVYLVLNEAAKRVFYKYVEQ